MGRPVVAILCLICSSSLLLGHDLWLVPPQSAKVNEKVEVQAVSGMDFPVGDQAPDPAKFAKRLVVDPSGVEGEAAAGGIRDKVGLLTFTPAKAGTWAVAVQTTPKLITLDADKFNEYLVSDGLPHIYALRSKEKSLDQPGKERYSKSPKALVQVGQGGDDRSTVALGLPLEIVPAQSPFTRKAGDTLKVKVLLNGKPLADAHLGWSYAGVKDGAVGTVRTDEAGEALVPLAKAGLFTIRLTHMTRPKEKDYEWESFWTTLTFCVP